MLRVCTKACRPALLPTAASTRLFTGLGQRVGLSIRFSRHRLSGLLGGALSRPFSSGGGGLTDQHVKYLFGLVFVLTGAAAVVPKLVSVSSKQPEPMRLSPVPIDLSGEEVYEVKALLADTPDLEARGLVEGYKQDYGLLLAAVGVDKAQLKEGSVKVMVKQVEDWAAKTSGSSPTRPISWFDRSGDGSITFPDFVAGQQLVLVLDNSKLSKEAKRQRIEKLNPRNARDIAKVNKLN